MGIAALMSHMGLSEGFGTFLLIALAIVAAIIVFRMLFRRPQPQAQGMQYAGAGLPTGGGQSAVGSNSPLQMFGSGGASTAIATAGLPEARALPFPPGFEPEPFLRQAKLNFAALQDAYDKGDTAALRDVMTPDMFTEVSRDLAGRGMHQPTEIVTLNGEILEVTTEKDMHWASVKFTGLLREDGVTIAQPFDEVWNLQKPVSGDSGWQLAGIQQLQQ
ncbi:MAG: Tim44-like domain-containing protein [Betaproteobacteria bacterium]